MMSTSPLLVIQNLSKTFPVGGSLFGKKMGRQVLNNVSLTISRGTTLGLLGESGSGKTTLARILLGLLPPSGGDIHFDGLDITDLYGKVALDIRCKMQFVFQDPYASLNPRKTVRFTLSEPLKIHGLYQSKGQEEKRIQDLLAHVQLPISSLDKYPNEFSGGQRQRIGIARALATKPSFIVLDEPVSALDVSIKAQIVNLLRDLQKSLGIAYLFIGHDLNIVGYLSDRVAVMCSGEIVEYGDPVALYKNPSHPYTKALLEAIPVPDPTYYKR